MSARRAEATRPPEVSWNLLAAQRRSIYSRIENPSRRVAGWVLSFALAMVFFISFGVLHPTTTAPLLNQSDQQLFSDLASIDQSNEPRAIKPIEQLFEP
jgi:hypothetical protein